MKIVSLSFPFSKLWNTEYPLFMERVLEVIEKHQPEQLQLQKPYERLKALEPLLGQIQIQAKASGITNIITDTDGLRDRLTIFLFKQIRNYKHLGIEPYVEKAKVLDLWIKKYNSSIYQENYTIQTEKTKLFLEEIEASKELKEALSVLNLTPFIAQLKEVNNEFEKLFRNRTEEVSKIPDVDVKEIRAKVDNEVNKLLRAIVFCKDEYEEKDYNPLINELTELFNYHKTQIKIRANSSKKHKENKSE